MNTINFQRVIGLLAIAFSSVSTHAETSLCLSGEETIFSCLTTKRYASVCASPNLSGSDAYITYRYGLPQRIEFEYPAKRVPPRGVFTFKPTWGTHGGTDVLGFENGGYSYAIWHIWDRGIDQRGVNVKHGDKIVAVLECKSKFIGDMSLDATITKFRNAGIPEPTGTTNGSF